MEEVNNNEKLEFEKKHLENIKTILNLYKENQSIEEIAKQVGMTENMVNLIIEKNIQEARYQNLINSIDNFEGVNKSR